MYPRGDIPVGPGSKPFWISCHLNPESNYYREKGVKSESLVFLRRTRTGPNRYGHWCIFPQLFLVKKYVPEPPFPEQRIQKQVWFVPSAWPCFWSSVVPEATHKARNRALEKGAVSAQKALHGPRPRQGSCREEWNKKMVPQWCFDDCKKVKSVGDDTSASAAWRKKSSIILRSSTLPLWGSSTVPPTNLPRILSSVRSGVTLKSWMAAVSVWAPF